jgi:type I restriction enzyme R subunit
LIIANWLDAHNSISTQALNSPTLREGLKDVLLNEGRSWESLRHRPAELHP